MFCDLRSLWVLAGRESGVCYGGCWQEMKPQVINSRAQMGSRLEVSESVAQVP